MARHSAVITNAELRVMAFLWEHGRSPVRDISKTIYGKNTAAYHATVNSLLDQLEAKGFVDRDRSGFSHQFSTKLDRATLVGKQLEEIAKSHFGGALAPILLALVDQLKLKPRDRSAIRKIVEDME